MTWKSLETQLKGGLKSILQAHRILFLFLSFTLSEIVVFMPIQFFHIYSLLGFATTVAKTNFFFVFNCNNINFEWISTHKIHSLCESNLKHHKKCKNREKFGVWINFNMQQIVDVYIAKWTILHFKMLFHRWITETTDWIPCQNKIELFMHLQHLFAVCYSIQLF